MTPRSGGGRRRSRRRHRGGLARRRLVERPPGPGRLAVGPDGRLSVGDALLGGRVHPDRRHLGPSTAAAPAVAVSAGDLYVGDLDRLRVAVFAPREASHLGGGDGGSRRRSTSTSTRGPGGSTSPIRRGRAGAGRHARRDAAPRRGPRSGSPSITRAARRGCSSATPARAGGASRRRRPGAWLRAGPGQLTRVGGVARGGGWSSPSTPTRRGSRSIPPARSQLHRRLGGLRIYVDAAVFPFRPPRRPSADSGRMRCSRSPARPCRSAPATPTATGSRTPGSWPAGSTRTTPPTAPPTPTGTGGPTPECALGTDPLLADTDGDGVPDGEEVRLGHSPSIPPTAGRSPRAGPDRATDQVVLDEAVVDPSGDPITFAGRSGGPVTLHGRRRRPWFASPPPGPTASAGRERRPRRQPPAETPTIRRRARRQRPDLGATWRSGHARQAVLLRPERGPPLAWVQADGYGRLAGADGPKPAFRPPATGVYLRPSSPTRRRESAPDRPVVVGDAGDQIPVRPRRRIYGWSGQILLDGSASVDPDQPRSPTPGGSSTDRGGDRGRRRGGRGLCRPPRASTASR